MVDSSQLTSGDAAPSKGEYVVVGPLGGVTKDTVTIERRGDTMPPTPKPNQHFEKLK